MAIKFWVGTTSAGDFNTAANWSASGVPADDDVLILGSQAGASLTSNLSQAGKNFELSVTEDFAYSIGSSGSFLTPEDGFTDLYFNLANPGSACYISGGAAAGILRATVKSRSPNESALVLGGITVRLDIHEGRVKLNSGATVSTLLKVGSPNGSLDSSKLTVPSGCTVNAATIHVSGGRVYLASNVGTVIQTGGEIYLQETATLTTIYGSGGKFYHNSTGTITTVDGNGTWIFDAQEDDRAKTVTNARFSGQSTFNINTGAQNITFTNGIYIDKSTVGGEVTPGTVLTVS